MSNFYEELDRKEQSDRMARLFNNRPSNLHDYQGCVNMQRERTVGIYLTRTPYIYQPFGVQNKEHWAAKRIYAVVTDSMLTAISGLTRDEADKILAALSTTSPEPPQAVGGWIRIEDGCEMPEDYEAVLVSGYDYGDKNMGRWINKSQFRNGRFRDVDYADHWARIVPPSLPTTPEKGDYVIRRWMR